MRAGEENRERERERERERNGAWSERHYERTCVVPGEDMSAVVYSERVLLSTTHFKTKPCMSRQASE